MSDEQGDFVTAVPEVRSLKSIGGLKGNSGLEARGSAAGSAAGEVEMKQITGSVSSNQRKIGSRLKTRESNFAPEIDSQYGNKLEELDQEVMEHESMPEEEEEEEETWQDPYDLRDPVSDDDDDPNIARNLSYKKVKKHVYDSHPFDR